MSITENNYIYGLHDSGGEALMQGKGWVVITEDVGRNPNDTSGANYASIAQQGLTVISRLNNGYGSTGTIPMPQYYRDFAVRCGNFVQASTGCNIWIIGNEPNLEAEWPDGNPIFPSDYAACYKLCRNEIRKRPGHQQDLVLLAGPGPWNATVKYATNPTGDWVQYLQDQIWGVQKFEDVDGVALHTYTHGHNPQLIRSTEKMEPPFENRHYNFWAYKDFLNGLQMMNFIDKPIYITETNGNDKDWPGGNNGWVREAYKDINAWNQQNPRQVIRCLALFRWRIDWLGYSIEDKPAVQEDFKGAVQKGYTWHDKIAPPQPPPQDIALAFARQTATHLQAAVASNQQTINALTDTDNVEEALTYAHDTATHLTAATESNEKTLAILGQDGHNPEAMQQARQTAAYLKLATTTNNNTIAALTAKR
ncbi:MAG: hypothetical protein KDJ65_23245 [Anaerolineae bacterium]|nr:hypothetical protein [Anaerolineae bacterium]